MDLNNLGAEAIRPKSQAADGLMGRAWNHRESWVLWLGVCVVLKFKIWKTPGSKTIFLP